MICPKCKISNNTEHSFCVECGTTLTKTSDTLANEEQTIFYQPEANIPTVYISPEKLTSPNNEEPAPTQFYSPAGSEKTEVLPADLSSSPDLQPTQHYSPVNTAPNNDVSTKAISQENLPPIVENSKSQSTANQFIPPDSVATVLVPKAELQPEELISETKKAPRKFLKILLASGILIVLLVIGAGTAAYFLAKPMQENKSYILTDKHQEKENTFTYDNQNKDFLMIATDNSNFQKWQITPTAGNKDYYRFVNRGLGTNESLEVIDDSQDSLVGMNKSAQDIGQYWAITNVKDDYYRITNQWLGDTKALSHSKIYYFFLRVRDSNNNDGQLWKKVPAPNGQGFHLVNKQYGDTVYLQALTQDEFKDKLVMKSGAYGNHQWNFNDVGNGFFNLATVQDGKLLDINASNSDRIKVSASTSLSSQRWKITPVNSEYFRLTNESLGDGKSLEAVTFSKFHVGMVKSSDNDLGQLWKISKVQ